MSDELDSVEQANTAQHVIACSACQAQIERLAQSANFDWLEHRLKEAARIEPHEPGLRQLMDALREHPPAEWLAAGKLTAAKQEVTFAGPVSDDAPLGWLGAYQILREVGSGVTSQVFEARDSRLGRIVALKVLRPHLAGQALARARFEREARAIAAIKDPHIVEVFEVGMSPDFPPYLVMEFVAGESLTARLQREGTLAPRDAAELARQIGLGLDAAHRQGIVHRDVKSPNVLFDAETGRVKIVDFGLARVTEILQQLTHDGLIAGTPAYMSPEQIRRPQAVDPRSDVYSAGVILYEMLTGEQPFRGVLRRVLFQVLHEEPFAPRRLNDQIPMDLETICLKAMSKEPTDRYETAAEFAADLQRWLNGQPIQARAIGVVGRAWRWCRRNPKLAALNAIVAAVLLAGFVDLTRYALPAASLQRKADLAQQETDRWRQAVERERYQTTRLAQTLVFDAQDAVADQAETLEQRRLLLEAAVDVLARADAGQHDDSAWQTLVVARNRLGDVFRKLARLDEAERQYRAAWGMCDSRTDPLPDQQTLAAETLANLGELELSRGRDQSALQWLEQAQEQAESAASRAVAPRDVALRVNALRTQSRCLQSSAVAARALGKFADVAAFQHARLDVLRQLAEIEPGSTLWIRESIRLHVELANTALRLEENSQAQAEADECLDLLDRWAPSATDMGLRRELAAERLRAAEILWKTDRHDEAIEQARRGLTAFEAMAAEATDRPPRREHVAAAGQLANYLIETKAFEAARPILEKGIAWCEQYVSDEVADLADHKSYVALQRNLALVEIRLGQSVEARQRLLGLDKHLGQLQSDARWANVAENRNWIEAQRHEVRSLGR